MGLMTYTQSLINSVRFFRLFKQKNKQKELIELALKERGILYKLIQNISPEMLETADITSKAIPQKEIIKIIEKNLSIKFQEHFDNISKPVFCASIGQVHKATMRDGRIAAIKIQYPSALSSINSQLNLLKAAALGSKISKVSKWKIDLNSHISMIEERLHEELNYQHELDNLIEYTKNNRDNKIKPYEKYSSSQVLTQTWIEGATIIEVSNSWSIESKKKIADVLVTHFFKQIFIDGFFQGDNNLSNFIISESPVEVHWIDFGNWVHISDDVRKSLYVMLYKTISKQNVNYLGYFKNIGFDLQKLQYFQNLLPNLIEILFDPFLSNIPFDLKNWKLEERVGNLLGENKWWFRSSGNSSFLEFMKSFYGFIKIIEFLDVNINWQGKFLEIVPNFNIDDVEVSIPVFPNSIPQRSRLAKQLVIQVLKNGEEHVKIELPAGSFFDLENLIPEDVNVKLRQRSINLSEIKFRYLEKGLVPGKVFELTDNATIFLVYLT